MSTPTDTEYYDVLGVAPDADEDAIRKGYYKAARRWHPDKNPGAEAEAKFKKISEAYAVLSDPAKRSMYDAQGSDFVDAEDMNMAATLSTLFGGGKFESVFGEPAEIPLLKMIVSNLENRDGDNVMETTTEQEKAREQEKQEKEEKEEEEECRRLGQFLLAKVQHYFKDEDHSTFRDICQAEAEFLADGPGGPELLRRVGYVYRQEGKQHAGRFFGLEGLWEEVVEKKHSFSGLFQVAWQAARLHAADKQLRRKAEESQQVEAPEGGEVDRHQAAAMRQQYMKPTEDAEAAQLQQEIVAAGLSTLWKVGLLGIEKRIRKVCELFLTEPTITKQDNRKRAEAVIALGEIFNEHAKLVIREREAQGAASESQHQQFGIPDFEK